MNLLEGLQENQSNIKQQNDELQAILGTSISSSPLLPKIGIGLDSCVIPLRHGGLSLIQTTDFFYPLIDDPYTMGRIACCNVLSDIYAMGVTECDSMLMLLGISQKMSNQERDVAIKLMINGFKDTAEEAGTTVQGGQSVMNPWVIIGGVATSVCLPDEFIMPDRAVSGDVLVLTKPLGTQVAVNVYQWMVENNDRWLNLKNGIISEEDVRKAFQRATVQMARLNRTAARLMHKYQAHACTDVTGFGLLGHARNLVQVQQEEVNFVIHNLPVIAKMSAVVKQLGGMFGLHEGRSSETSGGLLVVLPQEQAALYCKELSTIEGFPSWVIGIVESGTRTARIIERPRIIDVPSKDKENGDLW